MRKNVHFLLSAIKTFSKVFLPRFSGLKPDIESRSF